MKQKTSKAQKSTASGQNSEASSSDGSEGEEEVDDLPVMAAPMKKGGPRISVSAEVIGNYNKQVAYNPPVYDKSEEHKAAIKQRMASNFMFASLNPKDKLAVLNAIQGVNMKAGDVVIKEGDDGDNFYLVESGELTCSKRLNKTDAEDTYLKTYVPGESFGELALLYNAPRAATIVCKSDSYLWSLERMTFNSIIKTAVQKKREKYDEFLEKVEILKMMERGERDKLADAFKEEWYEANEMIIKDK